MREPMMQTRIFNPGAGRFEDLRTPLDRPAPADGTSARRLSENLLSASWQTPAPVLHVLAA